MSVWSRDPEPSLPREAVASARARWFGRKRDVDRREGDPADGFVPRERVSLEDTIKAYTLGAAFAGHREKTEGSIEPGKLADLIVLSQDLFKLDPSKVADMTVSLTMVGGKVVYQAEDKPAAGEMN